MKLDPWDKARYILLSILAILFALLIFAQQ